MAVAVHSVKMPSSSRNSLKEGPIYFSFMSVHQVSFAVTGNLQFRLRRLPGVFEESVQQNHAVSTDAEDDPGDPPARQIRSDLIKPLAKTSRRGRSLSLKKKMD